MPVATKPKLAIPKVDFPAPGSSETRTYDRAEVVQMSHYDVEAGTTNRHERLLDKQTISRVTRQDRETNEFYFLYMRSGVPEERIIDKEGFERVKPRVAAKALGDTRVVARFEDFARRIGYASPFDLFENNPEWQELQRMKQQFPLLAERFSKDLRAPEKQVDESLFSLGKVTIGHRVFAKFMPSREELLGFLSRHLAGDHGLYDVIDSPPTDDELFISIGAPINRQNAVAIAYQAGVVRSRFQLWSIDDTIAKEKSGRPYHRNMDDTIEITTCLCGHQTRTLITGSCCTDDF